MDTLDIELLTLIATQDLETFRDCLRVPEIGKRLCCEYTQGVAKAKFIRIVIDGKSTRYSLGGMLHRIDGPALYVEGCFKCWYRFNKPHRTDGPADEYSNGTKKWYINGKLHRKDGPAEEYNDGTKRWYINDKLHRLDGPAVERPNGRNEWWICGREVGR